MWKRCSFSGSAQYIVAGTTRQHSLYIWDKASGSLVKMLTGQKGETLLDVVVGINNQRVCRHSEHCDFVETEYAVIKMLPMIMNT